MHFAKLLLIFFKLVDLVLIILSFPFHQVKSGSIFDNFLLTNDEEFAEEVGNMTWGTRKVRYSLVWISRCLTPQLCTVLCI